MMAEMKHGTVETNGIRMHYVEHGTGPLVVMCHGFPESWYSWRHQLQALGEAGFHAVAPDMRGYGNTDRPADIDQYTLLHLTGDVLGLLDALGAESAVIAGHDWGAPVAWLAALLRPDRFPGWLKPSSSRMYARPSAVPSTGVPAMRRANRTAIQLGFALWCRGAVAGSRAGQTQRHSHPGSARPTWISTSGSSPEPALAAVSTGTVTSTATGSSWRPSRERE